MILSFSPNTHIYAVDGTPKPSTTKILTTLGIYSSHEFSEDYHSWRGTATHEGARIIDGGGSPHISGPSDLQQVIDDINNGFLPAFRSWKTRTKFQGVCWECPMIDAVAGFGVTFDVIGRFGNSPELILVELKSGMMPAMVPVQLAAQVAAIRKGSPVNPEHPGWAQVNELVRSGIPIRRCAVRLEKTTKDTMYTETAKGVSFDDPSWDVAWRSALNVFHLLSNNNLLKGKSI